MIILAGKYLNALSRPNVRITTPTVSLVHGYAATLLADGMLSRYVKFTQTAADGSRPYRIIADLALLKNGPNGATTPSFSGWTKIAGLAAAPSVGTGGDSQAFKCVDGAVTYQDVYVRSGESLRLKWNIRADGTHGNATIFLQDTRTGRYYDGSAWVDDPTAIATEAGSTYAPGSKTLVAEPFSKTQAHLTRIRVLFCEGTTSGGSAIAWCKYLELIPGVSWSSLHGTNTPQSAGPDLYYSDSISSGLLTSATLATRMDARFPAFYSVLASVAFARYWEINFGANTLMPPVIICEWILGEYVKIQPAGNYGATVDYAWPFTTVASAQVRKTRTFARYSVVPPSRVLKMDFRYKSYEQWRIAEEWFALRNRVGVDDIVVAPWDPVLAKGLDPDTVVYGGMSGAFGHAKIEANGEIRDSSSWQILEDTYPQFA